MFSSPVLGGDRCNLQGHRKILLALCGVINFYPFEHLKKSFH